MTEPIRVLVADDQALLRASFRMLIDEPGFAVVGEADTGRTAVQIARLARPDIVLMDIRMPDLDGIEATRQICGSRETANVRVLILTMFDLDMYVYPALRAGASGFLLKDTPPGYLLAAIKVVAGGDALLAPSVARRLIAEFARSHEPVGPYARPLHGFTERERDVLTLVARGLSNTEIADRLRVTLATVKTHVSQMLTKLDARDRALSSSSSPKLVLYVRCLRAGAGCQPAPAPGGGECADTRTAPFTPRKPLHTAGQR